MFEEVVGGVFCLLGVDVAGEDGYDGVFAVGLGVGLGNDPAVEFATGKEGWFGRGLQHFFLIVFLEEESLLSKNKKIKLCK